MLISNSNPKKAALTRFVDSNSPIKKVKNAPAWETKPRNKEQQYALNLLMDPSIPVVNNWQSRVGKDLVSPRSRLRTDSRQFNI